MGSHRDFSFILGISNFMLLSLHNGQKPHSAEILSKSSRNADLDADMPKNQIPSQFLDIFEISQKCALSLPKSLHMAKDGFLQTFPTFSENRFSKSRNFLCPHPEIFFLNLCIYVHTVVPGKVSTIIPLFRA